MPQHHDGPFAVRLGGVGEDLLAHILCPAVGVRAVAGPRRFVHGHGVVRRVHRRGRGEDELLDAVRRHCLAKMNGDAEVVVIVAQRLLHRLPHRLETGKMEDAVKGVCLEERVELCPVEKIGFADLDGLSGDLLHAADAFAAGVYEIVHNDDGMPCVEQLHAGVAADVAGAAGNENIHCNTSRYVLVCLNFTAWDGESQGGGARQTVHRRGFFISRSARDPPRPRGTALFWRARHT